MLNSSTSFGEQILWHHYLVNLCYSRCIGYRILASLCIGAYSAFDGAASLLPQGPEGRGPPGNVEREASAQGEIGGGNDLHSHKGITVHIEMILLKVRFHNNHAWHCVLVLLAQYTISACCLVE